LNLVGYQVPNDIFGVHTIDILYASVTKTNNTYGPESLYRGYPFLEYCHKNMITHKPRFTGGPTSPDLLKVNLEIISPSLCRRNYASIGKNQLMHGIVEDSMICAGYAGGEKDTCAVSYCMCFLLTLTF